jgi:hypothetical protein
MIYEIIVFHKDFKSFKVVSYFMNILKNIKHQPDLLKVQALAGRDFLCHRILQVVELLFQAVWHTSFAKGTERLRKRHAVSIRCCTYELNPHCQNVFQSDSGASAVSSRSKGTASGSITSSNSRA